MPPSLAPTPLEALGDADLEQIARGKQFQRLADWCQAAEITVTANFSFICRLLHQSNVHLGFIGFLQSQPAPQAMLEEVTSFHLLSLLNLGQM